MPAGNGTGPRGEGPMTGRRAGYCSGYPAPGYANPAPRIGLGRGFGRDRGFSRFPAYDGGFYRPAPVYREPSVEEERTYLKNAMSGLEEQMKEIKQRLKDLENEK
ncbi:MAG: DUF5320 domain-containing protein [Candidatus Altiarchaeales archaeon]|nr:DUF5320 domain-containing protein [Candidatus Altiarchaeota archaeon]MCG2782082.1 DUF5320 domain-containing protein [Candidatus Altiarchaeales archaeon]MBU4266139.1 DUF5320 domain-containing protein [Candidatus Altiarchaeota archaeon]MBU4341038.1 DUF5320 domain-containing protein [Candidatus Altiarchaeota archaeon]MBU4406081.1 DUF5320 domain-containing protein [Candidatus Altiarchaeota archaeon]